ncbi:expressed protein [Batrachochytrium dendrobatidis JAM81]|uniref:Expressed protein n=1 Tax=Batrachochytrium dendrobatidis (strain JAM81 / FGSC 10211) TaxID=684364 RepID=F4PBC2_BATDJ|nr:uncharacterized protein BATDEDRAFT_91650 [Batrachochytrium dendrobatidis JAM81]EGF77418.1 expressed protein [Batrachochytrium dendrobatidis JAM81]KAJ8327716.1 hypothetical protein O5D80_004053 [Batrachochytrium dendrobatidis]KAK5669343.1 hypothetical protein QVD99_003741 [Batrachochytrium dendrobatidis]|eukprot:XP_006682069.1 expressed protein [Batrachochytrium dendrobatidis JAM81]
MSSVFAKTALRAKASLRLVRGGHKVSSWGPIHFEGINWVGNGAVPFSSKNPILFKSVFWIVSAAVFAIPFYSVERKVWHLRVAKWEAEKASKE